MNNANYDNVPNMRFPKFNEGWDEKTVDELFEVITDYVAGGSFADIKKNVKYLKNEDYAQLVRVVDLKKDFQNDDFIFIDKHAFDYLWRVNLDEESIVLPNIGANIGEVYFINPNKLPYRNNALAPNAVLLKSSNNIKFKYYLFNTTQFKNQLDIINESTGAGKFNKTNLKKIKLFLPNSEEQKKIASFLSAIDKKIELLEKKQTNLLDFKKGLLNKIFINDNPDSWTEYKISDLGVFKSGYAFKNKYQGFLNYNIPFFKVSDMNLNFKYMEESQNTVNEEMCAEMKCKILEKPSLIIAKLGEAIYLERKRITNNPCVIDNNLLAFQPSENFDLEFIYYMFLNYNLSKYAQQTAVPSLSPKDIGDIKCFVPDSIGEQKRIANIFLIIDKKIELLENELDCINEFKKGLLQKMFV